MVLVTPLTCRVQHSCCNIPISLTDGLSSRQYGVVCSARARQQVSDLAIGKCRRSLLCSESDWTSSVFNRPARCVLGRASRNSSTIQRVSLYLVRISSPCLSPRSCRRPSPGEIAEYWGSRCWKPCPRQRLPPTRTHADIFRMLQFKHVTGAHNSCYCVRPKGGPAPARIHDESNLENRQDLR
jgi:hypothetical protein